MSDPVVSAVTSSSTALTGTIAAVAAVGVTVAAAKWAWPIGIRMFKGLISK
jgi:hypothetical protein